MNTLKGSITKIQTSGSLSILGITVGSITLKTILIESSNTSSHLRIGNPISVIFKETEVVIGIEGVHRISMQNRLEGTIIQIEKGELLSKIIIETSVGEIKSIITSSAVKQLKLTTGKKVVAMIKTNEIMISK